MNRMEGPLIISILIITRHERKMISLRMERDALLVNLMQKTFGLLIILPGSINSAESAEGEFNSLIVSFNAPLTHAHLPLRVQPDELIIPKAMTVRSGHQTRRAVAHSVQAGGGGDVPELSPVNIRRKLREFIQNIVGNIVHEPLEALALLPLFKFKLLGDVSMVQESREGFASVEELLVLFIKPGLDDPLVVDRDKRAFLFVREFSESVGHEPAVDVTHVGARHPEDATATLPDLEGELEVLSAPDQETFIVAA